MSRPRRAGVLAIALAAAAAGFVRTTDSQTEVCLYWPDRSVGWRLNPSRAFTSESCAGDAALDAVAQGFAAWPAATRAGGSAPCTDLELPWEGITDRTEAGYVRNGPNENLVVFRAGWCSDHVDPADGCWESGSCANAYDCFQDDSHSDRNVIAITTVTYDTGSGVILDADIEVADWDGAGTDLETPASNGWYFTCGDEVPQCSRYGDGNCSFIDLRNTLTHEVGHLVGLAHVARTAANQTVTMYPDTRPGDRTKRDLSGDDVAGVCTVYPRAERSPTCSVEEEGGCGTSGGAPGGAGGGLLAAVAALLALRYGSRR
jgi:hypothetical protein